MSVKEALSAIFSVHYKELLLDSWDTSCCLFMNRGDYIPDDIIIEFHQDLLNTIPHYFKLIMYTKMKSLWSQEESDITHFLYCGTDNTFKYVSTRKYIDNVDSTGLVYNSLGRILQNIKWEPIDFVDRCCSIE